MDCVICPDNQDVSLYSNGRSLDVDMEVHILVVSEALVVMVVLVVTLVKVAMVVTVPVHSQLLDSVCGFT
jgi:hypothetical protein